MIFQIIPHPASRLLHQRPEIFFPERLLPPFRFLLHIHFLIHTVYDIPGDRHTITVIFKQLLLFLRKKHPGLRNILLHLSVVKQQLFFADHIKNFLIAYGCEPRQYLSPAAQDHPDILTPDQRNDRLFYVFIVTVFVLCQLLQIIDHYDLPPSGLRRF